MKDFEAMNILSVEAARHDNLAKLKDGAEIKAGHQIVSECMRYAADLIANQHSARPGIPSSACSLLQGEDKSQTKICRFTVPGEPKGKARTRSSSGRRYTPDDTVRYERDVAAEYRRQCGAVRFERMGNGKLNQPVSVTVTAYYAVPRGFTKGKRLAAQHNVIRPTKKPDADNIAKIICDALNGVAYKDDTQVVELVVRKYWGTPRVEVEVEAADHGGFEKGYVAKRSETGTKDDQK